MKPEDINMCSRKCTKPFLYAFCEIRGSMYVSKDFTLDILFERTSHRIVDTYVEN